MLEEWCARLRILLLKVSIGVSFFAVVLLCFVAENGGEMKESDESCFVSFSRFEKKFFIH